MIHSLLVLILVFCVIGLVLWGVGKVPMPDIMKTIIYVIAGIVAIIYAFSIFGIHLPI